MSTKMLRMREVDKAWVGGVISVFGIFNLSRHAHPVVELLIRSRKHKEAVIKLGQLVGIPHKRKRKINWEVRISSAELAMLWPLVRPYVTGVRDIEFNMMLKEAALRAKEHDEHIAAKREYEAERANAVPSSAAAIRAREEALYHNQDAAVTVIGGIEADMAVAYDIEQAKLDRERAARALSPTKRRV